MAACACPVRMSWLSMFEKWLLGWNMLRECNIRQIFNSFFLIGHFCFPFPWYLNCCKWRCWVWCSMCVCFIVFMNERCRQNCVDFFLFFLISYFNVFLNSGMSDSALSESLMLVHLQSFIYFLLKSWRKRKYYGITFQIFTSHQSHIFLERWGKTCFAFSPWRCVVKHFKSHCRAGVLLHFRVYLSPSSVPAVIVFINVFFMITLIDNIHNNKHCIFNTAF